MIFLLLLPSVVCRPQSHQQNYFHGPHQPTALYPSAEINEDQYSEPSFLSNYKSETNCLSRIRLAASFDLNISININRYLDSLRIDKLRSFVCEKASFFCSSDEQQAVGKVFERFDETMVIIDEVLGNLTTTEKDQLNIIENINDGLAQQAFFLTKFHQLPSDKFAVLNIARTSLTTSLQEGEPNVNLSRAMGSFSQDDLTHIEGSIEPAKVIEDKLARCHIQDPETVRDVVSFIQSLTFSKMPYSKF